VRRRLRLGAYLRAPGDGRVRPQLPAGVLLWALLIGQVLREVSFAAVEALVRSPARRALGVPQRFGDDALAYFTARLAPGPTRTALATAVRRAKRNKDPPANKLKHRERCWTKGAASGKRGWETFVVATRSAARE
jgi:hypothetical protein